MNKGPVLLGKLLDFFKKAIKFYDLAIAPPVFVALLIAGFGNVLLPAGAGAIALPYNILCIAVIYVTSAVYLFAYLNELENKAYGRDEIWSFIKQKGITVIMATLLLALLIIAIFIPALLTGLNLFVLVLCTVAAFTVYITYFLNICFIINKNMQLGDSFRASKEVTRGRKGEIFLMLFVFNIVLTVPVSLITIPLLFLGFELAGSFALTFFSIVVNLMTQRFTALIYMALVNNEEPNKEEQSTQ